MVEALRLLLAVSDAGRTYKEIICESHGACSLTAAVSALISTGTAAMFVFLQGPQRQQSV